MLNACFVNPSSATKLIWGSTGQGYTRPQPACFLREAFPFLQTTYHEVQLYVEEILHSPLPLFPSLFSNHPQSSPPSFSPLCCRVTACRCCVRGVQLALCGLSVWSPLSREAANRVDEREQDCLL